jgi:hypothetical protein
MNRSMSQLALFKPEAPAAIMPARRGPRECLSDSIACPAIEAGLMEILRARPDELLDLCAFRVVAAKHDVGYGLGHKLGFMERRGLLDEKVVYLGRGISAVRPGSPDYQGFRTEYRPAGAGLAGRTV